MSRDAMLTRWRALWGDVVSPVVPRGHVRCGLCGALRPLGTAHGCRIVPDATLTKVDRVTLGNGG